MPQITRILHAAKRAPRPMIYPYTFAARLSQTPLVYEFKNSWFFRYFIYSCILTQPLWFWIHRKVNAPEYVAAVAAKKKADEHKEHVAHMWKDIEGKYANR